MTRVELESEETKAKVKRHQMVETQEMHCGACGRFLGFQAVVWGLLKIKCPTCKTWTTIDIQPIKSYTKELLKVYHG